MKRHSLARARMRQWAEALRPVGVAFAPRPRLAI
jgi:hypothetical protein